MAFGRKDTIRSGKDIADFLSRSTAQLIPARVVNVDQSTTLSNGTILVEPMGVTYTPQGSAGIAALPLLPNVKNRPLTNETVFLFSLPSGEYSNDPTKTKYYYLSPINIWNNPQVNPTPNQQENIGGSNQNKSLEEVELGSPNISTEQQTSKFKPGTYFTEKENIFQLYPFEGDYIVEGRFGNSIRLGSTNIDTQSQPTPLNNWSDSSENGDPITIIRNGQSPSLTGSAQTLITEEINSDLSSILLTSTQQVHITAASTNDYLSYNNSENTPEAVDQYIGSQVILNSDRLLFNTKEDHLMLSSAKSINLNAVQGIYFDTTQDIVFQSNRVYLGGTNNSQPVVLGDELVSLLTDVLNDLSSLTNSIQLQVSMPAGSPLTVMGPIAQAIKTKIPGYQQRLKNTLSNTTKTV